ncbi:MAG: DUF3373 family protein [Nitrospirota bacterium]
MNKSILAVLSLLLLTAVSVPAAEDGGLEIGLDYRFRIDSLSGSVHEYSQVDINPATGLPTGTYTGVQKYDVKNDSVFMNRFGMNLKANPVEDVTMKARLVMYKLAGHQTSNPVMGTFFADRYGATNDGTVSHVPEDSILRVDYAYATVSNIFDAPVWFSVGRRPSTGGIPSNIRQNSDKMGTAGIPSLMVNYAFDGMTLGYAPDIAALPGAYAKLCYGRGFDSGFQVDAPGAPTLRDTDFVGVNMAAYDSEKLHVEVQWQKGMNIFDAPSDAGVSTNLGDISWIGAVVTGKVSSLNLFVSAATSKTDPNDNLTGPGGAPMAGLMYNAGEKQSHSGSAIYLGGRYDIASTGTKIGAEYNRGSKNWISMVPAEDDLWTGKLGTRGDVIEVYVIQSLNRKPVAKKGEAFVRLGYQMYNFEYTGSNNWVGAPAKISELTTSQASGPQMLPPVEKAQDIYLTFDVKF